MRILRDWSCPISRPTALAVGCFDGVHLAHRKILQQVLSCRSAGLQPAVITFAGQTSKRVPQLMTLEQRLAVFESMGIELVVLLDFPMVRQLLPAQFVTEILQKRCQAKQIFCGYNFHFGKNGAGTTADLEALCTREGIAVSTLPPLEIGGMPVSSTRIRELVTRGEVEQAGTLLGQPYTLLLPVVHGKKLGRQLGFPTANQQIPAHMVQLKAGVYATRSRVDGKAYCSVTSVGYHPTVQGTSFTVETAIEGFSGDLYGKPLQVEFHAYLRPEQKFPSLDALKAQIEKDRRQAIAIYKNDR